MDEQLRQELIVINVKMAGLEAQVDTLSQAVTETKSLVETVHKLALSIERMTQEQQSLRRDVDDIRTSSRKRTDTVITETIRMLVAAVVGAFLVKLGLS